MNPASRIACWRLSFYSLIDYPFSCAIFTNYPKLSNDFKFLIIIVATDPIAELSAAHTVNSTGNNWFA